MYILVIGALAVLLVLGLVARRRDPLKLRMVLGVLLCLSLLLIGMNVQARWLFFLSSVLFAAIVLSYLLARLSLRGLEVTRQPPAGGDGGRRRPGAAGRAQHRAPGAAALPPGGRGVAEAGRRGCVGKGALPERRAWTPRAPGAAAALPGRPGPGAGRGEGGRCPSTATSRCSCPAWSPPPAASCGCPASSRPGASTPGAGSPCSRAAGSGWRPPAAMSRRPPA